MYATTRKSGSVPYFRLGFLVREQAELLLTRVHSLWARSELIYLLLG